MSLLYWCAHCPGIYHWLLVGVECMRREKQVRYSEELVDKICNRIAEGESLRSICSSKGMPKRQSVMRWLADETKTYLHIQYAAAREAQADYYADEIIALADGAELSHEGIAHARLQVDARKWVASKLKPKKYGDSVRQEHSGVVGTADVTSVLTDEQLLNIAKEVVRKDGYEFDE